MSTKILITNLSREVSSSDLEDMFSMVGDVQSAAIDRDESTGTSLGIGRVEMSTDEEARNGIDHFNGQKRYGTVLAVREDAPHIAKPISLKGKLRRQTYRDGKLLNRAKSK